MKYFSSHQTNTKYQEQCDKDYPYRCELGDTSSKVGTYDIGNGKRFYADEDTPLYGKYTGMNSNILLTLWNFYSTLENFILEII